MTNLLRQWVAITCPRLWIGCFLTVAVLLCWAATGWTLTPAPGTPIVNQATLQYGDANGNSLPSLTSTTSVPISGAPRLRLAKTADSNPVAPGATLTYTLLYENTGNAPATGVTLVDTLPANVTFQSATAGGVYHAAGRTVTWAIGSLAPGAGASLAVKVKVADFPAVGAQIVNAASIACAEGASESASLKINVGSAPNLVITGIASVTSISPGGFIDYTIRYTNIGNVTANNVFIRNSLPSETALVAGSITGEGSITGRLIEWKIGSLQPGASGTVGFRVKVSPIAVNGDMISNISSIISNETNAVHSNQLLIPVVAHPSLRFTKSVTPGNVSPGSQAVYTFNVTNDGDVKVTGIAIFDPLPAGTAFVSADVAATVNAGVVRLALEDLEPGATGTAHLTAAIDAAIAIGSNINNTASVTSVEAKTSTASATVSVNRTPGQVAFFDAKWQPAYGYLSSDEIYMQVNDADQNMDPSSIETVKVVLTSLATKDTETIILSETGPNTGIFRGAIKASLKASAPEDKILTVAVNSRIQVTYTDPLDAAPVSVASALIDPLGIAFDSITGKAVAGTVVAIRNWNALANACDLTSWPVLPPGQVNPAAPTGADGKFAFPLVPPGDYCFEVTPAAGYKFPSAVADAELPAGFTIGNGSRGEKFTLNAGDPPLIRDIPLDPPIGRLSVTKTANKTTAAIGDMIGYNLKITNGGAAPVTDIRLTDVMPHGVQYLAGSSRLNGSPVADPVVTGTRTFAWTFTSLAPAAVLEITYRSVAGADSLKGDGINTISAAGRSLGQTIASNTASAKVKITGGIFTDKGTILGKVFLDRDGNRMQNQGISSKPGKPDEPGIPDVALYLEDGTRVITDASGKYSITGVAPGTHVLRLDETSLPKGLMPVPLSNRFLGDGASQFLDMKAGGLLQANFAVERQGPEPVKEELHPKSKEGSEQPKERDEKGGAPFTSAQPAGADQSQAVVPPSALPAGKPVAKDAPAAAAAIPEKGGEGKPLMQAGGTSSCSSIAVTHEAATEKEAIPGKTEEKPLEPPKAPPLAWEEAIKTFSPELSFLSPADGAAKGRKQGRVVMKAPLGTNLSLFVNGEPVDPKQIGRRIEYPPKQVVIFEYIDVHLKAGEKNVLKAEVRDPFGIVRGTKEISVTVAGETEKIVVKADKTEVPADGQARIHVSISLRDKNGMVVSESGYATVFATAGEILEKDADPRAEGHQIALVDGEGLLTILAPRETGEAEITVSIHDRQETAKVFFAPHLRDFFMVGMGEVKIGHGQTSGDYGYLKDQDWFDDGPYKYGRGAFFLKGRFFKNFLITAAYDSDKKKRNDLFRENDTALDTEDKYPIYGDESKTGYEALSTDKLYLKIEKNRSYLMYGDYKTDLNDVRLTAYNRSFTGLKYDLNTPLFKVRAFGSYTDQTQVMDALPGRGISGYYYLTKRPVVEGSERVVLEVRDRYRPDNVLSRESKSRGVDYEMDYDQGTILFKGPVPSHDGDYNPVYVVASYESKADGEKYYVYGGRGSFKIFDFLEIGATGVTEEKALGNYQLWGTDVTINLPRKTIIKAEYAQTKAIFEESSMFNWQSDRGWSFTAESEPLEKLMLKAYYRTLGNYFMNMSAADVSRGTTKYGMDAAYALRPDTQIKGQFYDEKDDLNNMRHSLGSIGAQTKYKIFKFNAEFSRESSTATYIPPASSTTRSPFDVSQDIPRELTAVKVGMEADLLKDLSFLLNHKHNLSGDTFHSTQAGLNYQLNQANRLYLKEEYQQFQDRAETRTLFGVESQIIKNTVAFNEYRLVNAASGSRNQGIIGLRNKFFISKDLTGDATAEYLRTVSGTPRQGEPDAVAMTLGVEYLAPKNTKVTGRFEHRRELIDSGLHSYLGELGVAYKLHQDYSLLLRERYFTEEGNAAGRHTTSRAMIGLAYRPLFSNVFNALTKMEYKHETNSGSSPALKEDAYIFSGEGIWQATQRLQLMGKYAGKLSSDSDFSSYTDLVATRFIYDLTERWDVGAEYRLLTSHAVNSRLHGGSVEVGYRIIKNLWASVGYSFDKFDADLSGDGYQGQGPYLKLRFKFDEKMLRNLNPLAGKNSSPLPQAASSMTQTISSSPGK
jgi:uncharacterized repeat protein (TIGR01451 family)